MHLIYKEEVLLQQLRDLYIVDIQLMLGNKAEQHIEGSLEHIKLE